GGRRAAICERGAPLAQRPLELRALDLVEVGAEVQHAGADVVTLEVRRAAVDVHEAAGGEARFLEVDEPDAPRAALDRPLAAAALRLAARRAFRAVDAHEPALGRGRPGERLESLALGHVLLRFRQRLQHRLRTLVGGADR